MKAERKKFQYKSGDRAGAEGEYIKPTFAITNHPQYAGRRVYPKPLFAGASTFRALRRVMDATGVQQIPGTGLDEWLGSMNEAKPELKLFVTQVPDGRGGVNPDGTPVMDNDVNWKEVHPA